MKKLLFLSMILTLFAIGGAGARNPVNNLCYTTMTCTTDAEWEAGYYAFCSQNPASPHCNGQANGGGEGAQEPMNNLCYTVMTCTTDAEWEAGYYAFCSQNPASAHCTVRGASGGDTRDADENVDIHGNPKPYDLNTGDDDSSGNDEGGGSDSGSSSYTIEDDPFYTGDPYRRERTRCYSGSGICVRP